MRRSKWLCGFEVATGGRQPAELVQYYAPGYECFSEHLVQSVTARDPDRLVEQPECLPVLQGVALGPG
jgi:hypothetical protein